MASRYRILRTQAVTLSHTFSPDEIPTAATGTVTVTLSREDGTVVSTGNATGPDAAQEYTYDYAGGPDVDRLDVLWGATVNGDVLALDQDVLEIVGGHYFGVAEARLFDTAIASPTKFPTAMIQATRIEVEDEADRICRQAFAPRFERELLDGTGRADLRLTWPLVRRLLKVSAANQYGDPLVDFTADQLARAAPGDDGVIRLDSGFFWSATNWVWGAVWPLGRRNVLVEYEHGHDRPPVNISRAGKIRLKSMLLEPRSALPDRAERIPQTPTTGTVTYDPDADRTGVPAVDAIYFRYPSPRPDFG